jgi:DNA processing protein
MCSPVREERRLLFALLGIRGVSWNFVAREARRPEGLKRLLDNASEERSREAIESLALIREGLRSLPQLEERAVRIVEQAESDGVRLTTVLDDDYPLNLRTIFNLPPFLFYRGELRDDDARAVAVVGTRQPSPRGLRRATEMARLLAGQGVTVLSGLARGIDTAAHEACLIADGRTIAVLGSGIRRVYPSENAAFAERLAEHGAVVSQFWPDAAPTQYTFPLRNVVTSGMGQGTVVIEASATSGAKMQARLALDHGKKVWLPRELVDEHAWARRYVERGALLVDGIDDIIQHLRSPEDVRTRALVSSQLALAL